MISTRKLLVGLAAVAVSAGASLLVAGPAQADSCTSMGHPHYYKSSVGEYVDDQAITVYDCASTATNQSYIKVRNNHTYGLSGWAAKVYQNLPPYTAWRTIPLLYSTDWNSPSNWRALEVRIHYTIGSNYYTCDKNN